MGSFFGKNKTVDMRSKSDTGPWSPQGDQLKQIFSKAQDAYGDTMSAGTYSGQRVADLNPQISGAAQAGQNLGVTNNPATGVINASQPGFGGLNQYMQNMPHTFDFGARNMTGSTIDAANRYANNPAIDGVIQAANRDVYRDLRENTLPSLNNQAAATNNINSSRAGAAEAIARRGAADRMADTAAGIRGNAYTTGLGLGAQQQQNRFTNMMAANQGNLAGYNAGTATALQGLQSGMSGIKDSAVLGGILQDYDQNRLNADMKAFYENRDLNFDSLDRWKRLVQGSYGQHTDAITPTREYKPGTFDRIVQGSQAAASVIGTFGGAFMSDERVKHIGPKVGETSAGVPIHKWSYVWDPHTIHEGFIAQEVEKTQPEAVVTLDSGLKAVYYDRVQ